jgi:DNA-directed RNA polymerase sigma subunit (sigma70/sigma32)
MDKPRFINNDCDVSLSVVGEAMGLPSRMIQRIEQQALKKLRAELARRGYPATDIREALRGLDQARW